MYSRKFSKIFKTCTTFKIQVLSTSAIKCQSKFRIFQFALAMRWQKNCRRFNINYCLSCLQWLWHTSAFCQGLWFSFLTVDTTYSTYAMLFILITHLNGRNRRQYFSHWSPYFFCVCSCYNRRKCYPMLEKLGAQNIIPCENLGKQHELSDHWQ